MTCNNKLCKTPDAIISVSSDPGYCHKCAYLAKNTGYFKDAVTPINSCKGCGHPTINELCWHCNHDRECQDCSTTSDPRDYGLCPSCEQADTECMC